MAKKASGDAPLILHIDDEAEIRDAVAQVLQLKGFRVQGAGRLVDGIQEALRLKPDVILLDLHMPDGDGFEACAAMRALPELAATPIIMLTGMRDPDHNRKAKALGAVDVLHKPFSADELAATIRRRCPA